MVLVPDDRLIHVGDEVLSSWPEPSPIECLETRFELDFIPDGDVSLEIRYFGIGGSNSVSLNGSLVGRLPNQGDAGKWDMVALAVQKRALRIGRNSLSICCGPNIDPDFPGDLDDFLVNTVKLVSQ